MATQYSDIYIDGITTEKLHADNGQIVEAWLNGECIWKLGDNLVIDKVFQMIKHGEKYYVLFHAGELISGSPNGNSTWRNTNYYIGSGETMGIITDKEVIKNEFYRRESNQQYFIAVECENGLFVYYGLAYSVGASYMFFDNYNIHDEKTYLEKSPFNNKSETLFEYQDGIRLNAVMTDKYIFFYSYNQTYKKKLNVTSLNHEIIKEIYDDTDQGLDFSYLSTDGGDKIYFKYSYGSDLYILNYGIIDINTLEYSRKSFNFESIAADMLDDFITLSGNKYKRVDMTKITPSGELKSIYALSVGKYINAKISFLGTYLNKETQKKETLSLSGNVIINLDSYAYEIGSFEAIYDLGDKYMVNYCEGIGRYLSHNMNVIEDKWAMLMYGPTQINSIYENNFYMHDVYGKNNKKHDYIVSYNKTYCSVDQRTEIKLEE